MSNLPKLAELHYDVDKAFENDEFNKLVNQPPHASWLKEHPLVKVKNENGQWVPLKYLPIDKVEWMMIRIFQHYKVEIKSVGECFNSVLAIVRVHYLHPVTGEWMFHDGAGGAPAQTNQGATAFDLTAIKSNAVQIGAPAAVSYAIKDACEHIGKLFGRDLNKWDALAFKGAYDEEPPAPKTEDNQTLNNIQL